MLPTGCIDVFHWPVDPRGVGGYSPIKMTGVLVVNFRKHPQQVPHSHFVGVATPLRGTNSEIKKNYRIGFMRDDVASSKYTTYPRLRQLFSSFYHLHDVFTRVLFSSLVLWEFVHNKI